MVSEAEDQGAGVKPTTRMVIALADDQTAHIFDDSDNPNAWCEGIDVADNGYSFIDERGFVLVPHFIKPTRRGRFIGLIPWAVSGTFVLKATTQRLLNLLDDVIAQRVIINCWPARFKTRMDLLSFLQRSRPNDLHDLEELS